MEDDVYMVLEGLLAEMEGQQAGASTLLFYKVLCKDLEDYRFVINPYDPCFVNKEIDKVLEWLGGNNGKLKTIKGEKHDYLGMILDFSLAGRRVVNMKDYVDSTIDDLPQDIVKNLLTPAGSNLFK
eukprot:10368120-Ditylum_brightwellii.AAC.1